MGIFRGIFVERPMPDYAQQICKEQKKKIKIMQGDSYPLSILLFDSVGTKITPEVAKNIEFTVGNITKTYCKGEVTFNGNYWLYPLTQKDTFSLRAGAQSVKTRVKFITNDVKGDFLGEIYILPSDSKEVL